MQIVNKRETKKTQSVIIKIVTLNFLWNAWKSKNDRMSGDKKFLRDAQTTNLYYDGFLKAVLFVLFAAS